ncbi:MAG: hypothetical protein Q9168_007102 [Polycauliona sp. 1 TL-2023]
MAIHRIAMAQASPRAVSVFRRLGPPVISKQAAFRMSSQAAPLDNERTNSIPIPKRGGPLGHRRKKHFNVYKQGAPTAQAVPLLEHRRTKSFKIRKHSAFPTADQPSPSSTLGSPISYQTTGSNIDISQGFKRRTDYSYDGQWRRGKDVSCPKSDPTQESDARESSAHEQRNPIVDGINLPAARNRSAMGKLPEKAIRYDPNPWADRGQDAPSDLEPMNHSTEPKVSASTVDALRGQSRKKDLLKPTLRDNAIETHTRKKLHLRKIHNWAMQTPKQILARKLHDTNNRDNNAKAFSTSTRRSNPSSARPTAPEPISVDQFHRLADHYIDALVSKLEELQEERREVDCEYSAGVLNLDFPPAGTYVFNKQPPNKQIWLSSPISGPKRYDYVLMSPASPEISDQSSGGDGAAKSGAGIEEAEKKGEWMYLRDGSTLTELLKEELGVDMDEEG